MGWWQYLLLVNLYLLLFYGFYSLLLRSETFFQLNRIYLVSSALLSFFIPLMHADWVRNLFITQRVQYKLLTYSSPIMVYHFKAIEDQHITTAQLILYIYIAGAIVLAARFAWQLVSLKKIINTPGPVGAFSFFKKINLGENVDNRDVIEAHEQVHAREWHSADILLIEAISIINWFNPVVYFYRFGIKHIHEFIADRQALKNGTDKAEYALLLLSQTLKTPSHQLVNPFYTHTLLKRRIIMLQKGRSQRKALLKYGLSAPLFILMLVLSSATIGGSRTVKLFNNKAEQVLSKLTADDDSVTEVNQNRGGGLNAGQSQRKVLLENKLNSYTVEIATDTIPKSKDPVFSMVEKEPEFIGGVSEFYHFLQQNIKFPAEMRKNNIQGRVFVSFIVEKDGSLSDIKTVRDLGYGGGDEAVRVLKLSPKWQPGYQNGRPVRVTYTLPINFTLDNIKTVKDTTLKTGSAEKASKTEFYSVNNNIRNVPGDTNKLYCVTNNNVLNSQSQPLYMLDGKAVSNLSLVDPADISSIMVLKQKPNDNSLIIQYGAKAANGVILVTTKKAPVKSIQLH